MPPRTLKPPGDSQSPRLSAHLLPEGFADLRRDCPPGSQPVERFETGSPQNHEAPREGTSVPTCRTGGVVILHESRLSRQLWRSRELSFQPNERRSRRSFVADITAGVVLFGVSTWASGISSLSGVTLRPDSAPVIGVRISLADSRPPRHGRPPGSRSPLSIHRRSVRRSSDDLHLDAGLGGRMSAAAAVERGNAPCQVIHITRRSIRTAAPRVTSCMSGCAAASWAAGAGSVAVVDLAGGVRGQWQAIRRAAYVRSLTCAFSSGPSWTPPAYPLRRRHAGDQVVVGRATACYASGRAVRVVR